MPSNGSAIVHDLDLNFNDLKRRFATTPLRLVLEALFLSRVCLSTKVLGQIVGVLEAWSFMFEAKFRCFLVIQKRLNQYETIDYRMYVHVGGGNLCCKLAARSPARSGPSFYGKIFWFLLFSLQYNLDVEIECRKIVCPAWYPCLLGTSTVLKGLSGTSSKPQQPYRVAWWFNTAICPSANTAGNKPIHPRVYELHPISAHGKVCRESVIYRQYFLKVPISYTMLRIRRQLSH